MSDGLDFVSDDTLRQFLTSDYQELKRAFDAECWKATHVLAGSIIESLLTFYLLHHEKNQQKKEQILEKTLGQLISMCKQKGLLSPVTTDLASVIKEYRNLIHPGRQLRRKDIPDENSARVATSLVDMIIKELAILWQQSQGYTSTQLISKIERDPSSGKLAKHLMKEMNESELEKLLLFSIPNKYLQLESEFPDSIGSDYRTMRITQKALADCFRTALQMAHEKTREKVSKKFVSLLREGGESEIHAYSSGFFRSMDLKYLDGSERHLVKDYVFNRLEQDFTDVELNLAERIVDFIVDNEVNRIVDPVIRECIYSEDNTFSERCKKFLERSFVLSKLNQKVIDRLRQWSSGLKSKGRTQLAEKVDEITSSLEISF